MQILRSLEKSWTNLVKNYVHWLMTIAWLDSNDKFEEWSGQLRWFEQQQRKVSKDHIFNLIKQALFTVQVEIFCRLAKFKSWVSYAGVFAENEQDYVPEFADSLSSNLEFPRLEFLLRMSKIMSQNLQTCGGWDMWFLYHLEKDNDRSNLWTCTCLRQPQIQWSQQIKVTLLVS